MLPTPAVRTAPEADAQWHHYAEHPAQPDAMRPVAAADLDAKRRSRLVCTPEMKDRAKREWRLPQQVLQDHSPGENSPAVLPSTDWTLQTPAHLISWRRGGVARALQSLQPHR